MFNRVLQAVQNVGPGQIATLRIAPEQFTLVGVQLQLTSATAGGFDKTKIDRIRVKIGPRVIWDLVGDQLNKINNYKNGADVSRYLLLDFTERTQAVFPVKELGGIDLRASLPIGEVMIEIYINATAIAPQILAIGQFEAPQGNLAVVKFVPFTLTQTQSGKFTLPLNLRGAMIKRLWIFYSGTNWSGWTADGNVSKVEVKKNGILIWEKSCRDVRFDAVNFKKVPQANTYCVDWIIDDNHDAVIPTVTDTPNGKIYDNFEFSVYLSDSSGSQLQVVAEVYDVPTNL